MTADPPATRAQHNQQRTIECLDAVIKSVLHLKQPLFLTRIANDQDHFQHSDPLLIRFA